MLGRITPPFFEFGPKTFLTRAPLLAVAEAATEAAVRYEVSVILTPPVLDIELVKSRFPGLWVFAQAMDDARPGNATGAVLPEALHAVGADGVLLNHVERPLHFEELRSAVIRAKEADLQTLVCAEDISEAASYAEWSPSIVLLEPRDLIGTALRQERPWIPVANNVLAAVDDSVLVMHGGGVADPNDAASVIAQGAAGTGCTSAIAMAADPAAMAIAMIRAVREAWDARFAVTSIVPPTKGIN